MPIYKCGLVIKKRREEMRLSQDEIAEGICSVPTLSRIENGSRLPTPSNFSVIMQRLGYSESFIDNYANEAEFEMHEIKFLIRDSYIMNEYDESKRYLREFERRIEEHNPIDDQFILLYNTLLRHKKDTIQERLKLFEKALRMTYPNYGKDKRFHVLSFEEILILNNIANCYSDMGDRKKAIEIYYGIKEYYDTKIINIEEVMRTKPMIMYNLAKALILEKRLNEAMGICDLNIEASIRYKRSAYLPNTLYLKAYAYVEQNSEGDIDLAKKYIADAYYAAFALHNQEILNCCREFIKECFDDDSFMNIYQGIK